MTLGTIRFAMLVSLVLSFGCATAQTNPEEPLPRHPFPRWVSHLEPERTDIDEVLLVFGDPVEIEVPRRGETRWRYALREIHWAPNDPDRPAIAADGTRTPRTPTTWDRVGDGFASAGSFVKALLVYPAPRASRPKARSMPATIHALELSFADDGTLRRYRYAPRNEHVLVWPDRD